MVVSVRDPLVRSRAFESQKEPRTTSTASWILQAAVAGGLSLEILLVLGFELSSQLPRFLPILEDGFAPGVLLRGLFDRICSRGELKQQSSELLGCPASLQRQGLQPDRSAPDRNIR